MRDIRDSANGHGAKTTGLGTNRFSVIGLDTATRFSVIGLDTATCGDGDGEVRA
ncbi:hypothetical protein ACI2K4_33325 [Micromonospora sp. NPDC050397]|uniref:hypothetical protein n=1 Tax=Micromonospora sp. NPDC050397 TaxID=3364279 RepID=UPI00384D5367